MSAFSLPLAVLVGVTGWIACLIKAYVGFGGGILYVSFLMLWNSFGLLGAEGGEHGLGGFVGCQGLVTVMDFAVSAPLAWQLRNKCHWPLCLAITLGTLPLVPVGTSILQLTETDVGEDIALVLKRIFGVLLLAVVALQISVGWYEKRKKAAQQLAKADALVSEISLEEGHRGPAELPNASLLSNAAPLSAADFAPAKKSQEMQEMAAGACEAPRSARSSPRAGDAAKPVSSAASSATTEMECEIQEAPPSDSRQVCSGNDQPGRPSEEVCKYERVLAFLERNVGGQWRHWERVIVLWGTVSGAAAGMLGALYGAGGPAVVVLSAYLNGREDLGATPDALRSTMIISYLFNITARMVMLTTNNMFHFDRWWAYYIFVTLGGLAGAFVGAWLYTQCKASVKSFQWILRAMLIFCGSFFLFTPA